jgi:hypothetical protein
VDQLGIANLALGWLGVAPLTSMDDPSAAGRRIKAAFDGIRDTVLEERDWAFATGRLQLALAPVAPPSTYAGRYAIPSTVLRVLRAWEVSTGSLASIGMNADDPDASTLEWQVESGFDNADGTGDVKRYVVADITSTSLNIKAIIRVEDASLWSPSFCQALAARIAADLCVPLTQKVDLASQMWSLYERKLSDAAANDSRQGAPLRFRSTWIRDRRS